MVRLERRADRTYHVIGLMSGTSGDGVDAALVRIDPAADGGARPQVATLAYETFPYDAELKRELFPLFDTDTARVDAICAMNVRLGEVFAEAARRVAERAGVPLGSGPDRFPRADDPPSSAQGAGHCGSPQIGEPAVIAERTGCT